MKTRQEMIYDFMVAIASNPDFLPNPDYSYPSEIFDAIVKETYDMAAALADKYLENL